MSFAIISRVYVAVMLAEDSHVADHSRAGTLPAQYFGFTGTRINADLERIAIENPQDSFKGQGQYNPRLIQQDRLAGFAEFL